MSSYWKLENEMFWEINIYTQDPELHSCWIWILKTVHARHHPDINKSRWLMSKTCEASQTRSFFTELAEREKKKSNYHISICQQVSNTSDLQLVFKKKKMMHLDSCPCEQSRSHRNIFFYYASQIS